MIVLGEEQSLCLVATKPIPCNNPKPRHIFERYDSFYLFFHYPYLTTPLLTPKAQPYHSVAIAELAMRCPTCKRTSQGFIRLIVGKLTPQIRDCSSTRSKVQGFGFRVEGVLEVRTPFGTPLDSDCMHRA